MLWSGHFLGGSGSLKVPEPTQLRHRPDWVGSGSRQQKRQLLAAPAPYTKICNFEQLKSYLLMQVFFASHLPF